MKAAGPCSALTFMTGGRGEVSNGTGPGGFRSSGQRQDFARVPGRGTCPVSRRLYRGEPAPHPTRSDDLCLVYLLTAHFEEVTFRQTDTHSVLSDHVKGSFQVLDFFFFNPIPNFKQHLIPGCIAHARHRDG